MTRVRVLCAPLLALAVLAGARPAWCAAPAATGAGSGSAAAMSFSWARTAHAYAARGPGLSFHVGPAGTIVGRRRSSWRIRLRAVGRAGSASVELSPARPRMLSATILAASRGPLSEWWVNGPRGLELGWSIRTRIAGGGPLLLSFAEKGDARGLVHDRTLTLAPGLRFGGLSVVDANGRRLAARFTRMPSGFGIRVDDRRAAYPVTVDPWIQQQEFTSQDPPAAGESFGATIVEDAAGDTALVANSSGTVGGHADQGVVYAFTRSGTTWSQEAKLTASDGATEDQFGSAIAISPDGSTALIGAPGHQSVGAAYVFSRSGSAWGQQAELTQPGGASAGDEFGSSVAIAGGTALVSNPSLQAGPAAGDGGVYVFTGGGTAWTPTATLASGVQLDNFGASVSLSVSGDTALVGAPTQSDPLATGAGTGSVYVFSASAGSWSRQAKLSASDSATGDTFGAAVALSGAGDTALIGAPDHTVGTAARQGAGYVFTRDGSVWSEQQELTAPDGFANDMLGADLGLSADGATALLGLPAHNGFRGAGYAFVRAGTSWSNSGTLVASDSAAGDELGTAVGVDGSGHMALLGAPGKGSVYAFVLPSGPPQITASALVSAQSTSINVAATIKPSGLDTRYHVEWGKTASYGASGPELPQNGALTGFSPIDVLAQLTGLAGDTAYHWRIVATNADGISFGPDHVDRTLSIPWIPHETVPPRGHTSFPVPVSSVGSIAGSAPVASYGWDFSGNGTFGLVCPSTMPLAYHTYARPGRYTVALKITTVTGQTSVAKQQIVVGGGGNVIGGPPPNNSGGACASVVNGGSCIRIVDWGLIHAEIDDGGCFDESKPLRATPVTNCVVCPGAGRVASSQQEAYVGSDWWARFDHANGVVYSTLHPVNMNGLTFTPQNTGQTVNGVDKNRFVIDQADSYVFGPDVDVTIAHSKLQVGSHEAIDKFFPTVAPSILGVTAAIDRRSPIARTASGSSGFDNPCDDPDINQAPLLAQIGNKLPHAVGIDGFGIAGAIDVHVVNGEAVMCANATLPLFSSGPPGFRPLTVHATLISDSAGGLHLDNLHATLDDGYLGLVHFSHLEFSYDRANSRWEAGATMEILPGFAVSIDMAFETGAFRHGALAVDFSDPGFPVADSGVYITHIDGSVDNPAGGPLAVTGHVKLGAQPNVPGIGYLLTIDGGMGITFGDTPTVEVAGDAQLLGVTLANGDVKVSGDGSFSVTAHIDQRLFGVIGVVSDFSGAYWPRLNFNVEADSTLSVLDLVSIGGNFLVSSKGLAGCVALKAGPFHLHVGAGVTYSPFDVNLMFSSCDVGPWRVSRAGDTRARVTADGVLVSPGTQYEVIGVDGASAPPAVTVTGPGGASVSAPAVGHILTSDYLVAHDPAGKTTFVVIRAPRAGLWTVTPAAGSSAISRVRSAVSLPDPAVAARVTGTGRTRTLHYRIRRIPGQAVRFVESGRHAFGAIGHARGARGTLRFAPADGPAGIRSVIALVDENGIPRARIVVAHYRAPRPMKPATPTGLTLTRRGTSLLASWHHVAGATRYAVYVRISDGRRILRLLTATRLRLTAVAKTRRATVVVTAFHNTHHGGSATKTARPVVTRRRRPGKKRSHR